jgi:hypothetical protein
MGVLGVEGGGLGWGVAGLVSQPDTFTMGICSIGLFYLVAFFNHSAQMPWIFTLFLY